MKRIIVLGAAGRDFHNFNVVYRNDADYRVVAFTATQIPDIADRSYPPELAGPLYPEGIPLVAEEELETLIRERAAEAVVFSYSDVSHPTVMHLASRAVAAGADYEAILRQAEQEADLILWDGGNNDTPFYLPLGFGNRSGRPAAGWPRAGLLPGRGEPAPGQRGDYQQSGHGHAGSGGAGARQHPPAQPAGHHHRSRVLSDFTTAHHRQTAVPSS